MERDTFVFYKKWSEAISGLPSEIRLEIYESIIAYATTGKEPDLKMTARIGFAFVKADIDRDLKKYLKMIEKNRDNGQKGGRPPKETITQKNPLGFSQTQQNPKNLEYDNDLFIDNDISFLEKKKQKTHPLNACEGENENFSEANSQQPLANGEEKEKISPQPPDKKEKSLGDHHLSKNKIKPNLNEFLAYAEEIIVKNNLGDFSLLKFPLEAKFNQWEADNWKDGNGNPIKNWKTKLQNTLPYLKPITNNQMQKNYEQTTHTTSHRQQPTGGNNNTGQFSAGNAAASYQKISAHQFIAQKYARQFAQNHPEASAVIDVEARPIE